MVEIVLGLPKGSLNNVKRGNTYQLFIDAGYEVQGYEFLSLEKTGSRKSPY